MNNRTEGDDGFLERARSVHEAGVSCLGEPVLSRLCAARQRALMEVEQRQPLWYSQRWLLPAGLATVVLAGVVSSALIFTSNKQPATPFVTADNNDIPIVLSNDNLDMYADMDFYRWLQVQQQQADPQQPGNGDNG